MTDPLFDLEPLLKAEKEASWIQVCGSCPALVWASDEAIRVRGWLVFDGNSETGQPLHVRTCPACRRRGVEKIRQQYESALRPAAPRAEPPLPGV